MREITYEGEFDAVVNLFTAFGYFPEDEENARVFTAVAKALSPGGRFLVDVINPLRLAQVFRTKGWSQRDADSPIILEETSWDHMAGRLETERTMLHPDVRRRDRFSIRCYVLPELRRMAEAAAMDPVAAYGDFTGTPYNHQSHRIILHTKKPES
jgi:SAM-dependent methyltransferase